MIWQNVVKNCVHWHLCNTYGINTHCHDKDNVEELCRDFYDPDRCGVKHVYWISCSTGCTCCADQNFDLSKNDNLTLQDIAVKTNQDIRTTQAILTVLKKYGKIESIYIEQGKLWRVV